MPACWDRAPISPPVAAASNSSGQGRDKPARGHHGADARDRHEAEAGQQPRGPADCGTDAATGGSALGAIVLAVEIAIRERLGLFVIGIVGIADENADVAVARRLQLPVREPRL